MAKCQDCGRLIDPKRGYCTYFICHNKAIGGPTPEPLQQRARAFSRPDHKRCPFCTGERTGARPCFISACNRGPGGKPCGCHYQMAGMGSPGQEMAATLRARHLGVQAGGGARIVA